MKDKDRSSLTLSYPVPLRDNRQATLDATVKPGGRVEVYVKAAGRFLPDAPLTLNSENRLNDDSALFLARALQQQANFSNVEVDAILNAFQNEEWIKAVSEAKRSTGNGETATGSNALRLVEFALDNFDLGLDQHGAAFAWDAEEHELFMLRSREFKNALIHRFFSFHHAAASSEAVATAISILAAEAGQGRRNSLAVRVCNRDGSIIIDLCNERNEVVTVGKGGWKIESLDHPVFRRYLHMEPLEVKTGDPEDVKEFVNSFRLKDPEDAILLAGFIGSLFVDIPHPLLVLYGSQGAAKTTGSAALREVVDPSSLATLSMPHDQAEFVQLLAHHYCPVFDNVDELKPYQTDTLCRAATGEGFTKRELYTDEEDIIFSYRRPVILNGINPPSTRGDFLDRALLIETSRIPRAERLENEEVRRRTEKILPKVRGAILDALVHALDLVDEVREDLTGLPRMADFAVWGEAICRALGYQKMQFFDRYAKKIDETNAVALESDVVGELIIRLMTDEKIGAPRHTTKDVWEGTANELLKVLGDLNDEIRFVKEVELPRSPRTLSNWLNELVANLADEGIKIVRERTGRERKRIIRIERSTPSPRDIPATSSASSASSAGHNETNDKQADATADASKNAIVRPSSASPGDNETEGGGRKDAADASAGNSLPPGVSDFTPFRCPQSETCGFKGVILSSKAWAEHLARFHDGGGGVVT